MVDVKLFLDVKYELILFSKRFQKKPSFHVEAGKNYSSTVVKSVGKFYFDLKSDWLFPAVHENNLNPENEIKRYT